MIKLFMVLGCIALLAWQPGIIGIMLLMFIGGLLFDRCKAVRNDVKEEVEDWRAFREYRRSKRDNRPPTK